MADKKVEMAKLQALEQENIILRQQIADQEKMQSEMVNVLGGDISNEIKKIRAKGKSSANTIKVVEQNDHKNISLWTKWGKRIGPMHPENCIQALNRFADIGVILTSDQPTVQQIEAYKSTAEYKKMSKWEQERRALKDKSRRSGQMEKLCAEIARMAGTTVDAINSIKKPREVNR